MTADPRPPRRIVDPDAYREFHATGYTCLVCGEPNPEAHHVLLRSRGGDDAAGNFAPLCRRDHRAFHGTPYLNDFGVHVDAGMVRFALARWIESPDGAACRAYLVGKLGRGPADHFMHREFGIRTEAA
jgi:HNH endonuclease